MYNVRLPLPRSLLYGIGVVVVVMAAFAVGLVLAGSGRREAATVEAPATSLADQSADDILVVEAVERPQGFPVFAPEGVIVVHAPIPEERTFAASETVPHRARAGQPRIDERANARRLNERPRAPVEVAQADSSAPREVDEATDVTNSEVVDEPRQDTPPTRNEAPQVRESEYAESEDNRSWYGSEEYRREVEARRRAEREARRRRNEGW